MKIIIATIKSWNIDYAKKFQEKYSDYDVELIKDNTELTYQRIEDFNPDYIFFPHWSWIIPEEIYDNFNCIVFHMTDLPFGRGGSPLQNLIVRGIENTKISALEVDGVIDTGDIYLKEDLNLNGSAEEIFIRAAEIIFKRMIPEILNNDINPQPQEGQVVEFDRRKPAQSELKKDFDLEKIYDYIRMLDAEGYPEAFIKFGDYKLKFSRANLKYKKIIADVEIMEDEENE